MKQDTDKTIRDLREKLWSLEICLPHGWFAYQEALKREAIKWHYNHVSELPKLNKPTDLPVEILGCIETDLKESVTISSPDAAAYINSVQDRILKLYPEIEKTVRELRTAEVMKRIEESGLSNDDVFDMVSELSRLVGEVKKGEPVWLLGFSEDLLCKVLLVPIKIEIEDQELSLFSISRQLQPVAYEFATYSYEVRKEIHELAMLCARRNVKRCVSDFSRASVRWMELLAHMDCGGGIERVAYAPEQAKRIAAALFEALAAEWAENKLWSLSSASLPPEVVPYYYDIVKVYEPGKKIKLRDGTQLLNLDSTNPDLWKGIHDVLTKGDERGFCELPERWRRKLMRGGKKLSVGAKNVNKFLNHLEPEGRGRCGTRRYRIAR